MSGARRFESRLSLDASPALPIPWPSGAASAIGSVSLTVADRSCEEVSPLVLIERKRSTTSRAVLLTGDRASAATKTTTALPKTTRALRPAGGDDVRDARPR